MEQSIINTENNRPKRSYKTLWIMIVLFGLPYVAAWYFYFNKDSIDFGSQTNYGSIVTPARVIDEVNLITIDNTDFNTASLKGKWTIVTIGESLCLVDCQKNLYKMRQIRKALGQGRERVERLFLLTDSVNIQSFTRLINDEYQGTTVIINNGDLFAKFISVFSYTEQSLADGIYIVDPLGNFMMTYPKDAEATGILEDLSRLLKVSKIG